VAKKIAWTDQAKADVRAIDQPTAMRILHGLARFTQTEEGDVKRLQDIEPPEFRSRIGAYRIRFWRSNTARRRIAEEPMRLYRRPL
jgi:acyl-CoA-binding protein